MREKNIFTEEIEIPEIVQRKVDEALAKIKMEDTVMTGNKKMEKKKTIARTRAAAAAGICILALGSITTAAAVRHFWSRGMQGAVQATDEQQQQLLEDGMATVFDDTEKYESMAVTDHGVTIKPEGVIVADHFAHITFSVQGFSLEKGQDPCFEDMEQYLGDDPEDESNGLNMCGSFYDGIVSDENGNTVYDDGTPVESDLEAEFEPFIPRYYTEDGKLEFNMTVYNPADYVTLPGKTVHVEFHNLGTDHKTEYTNVLSGTWAFDIPLSEKSTSKEYAVDQKLGNSGFTVDTVSISPISIKIDYKVTGERPNPDFDKNITPPYLHGVVMRDGTRIEEITNAEISEYTDDTKQVYVMNSFDRVIDAEQVQSLLIGHLGCGEDEYEVIDLP